MSEKSECQKQEVIIFQIQNMGLQLICTIDKNQQSLQNTNCSYSFNKIFEKLLLNKIEQFPQFIHNCKQIFLSESFKKLEQNLILMNDIPRKLTQETIQLFFKVIMSFLKLFTSEIDYLKSKDFDPNKDMYGGTHIKFDMQFEHLNDNLTQQNNEIYHIENQKIKLQNYINTLIDEVNEKNQELDNLQEENAKKANIISEYIQESKKMLQKTNQYFKKNELQQKEIQNLSENIVVVNSKNDLLNSKIISLQEQIENLKQILNEVQSLYQIKNEHFQTLQSENFNLNNMILLLKQELNEKRIQQGTLKPKEIIELENQFIIKNNQMNTKIEKYYEYMQEAESHFDNLRLQYEQQVQNCSEITNNFGENEFTKTQFQKNFGQITQNRPSSSQLRQRSYKINNKNRFCNLPSITKQ